MFYYLKKYCIPTIKYILITFKHKFFVIIANYKYSLKCSLFRLIMHDLSKFNLFKETLWYGFQFFGNEKYKDGLDQYRFEKAWLHHQNHNMHHFEYWINRDNSKNGEYKFVEMPEIFVIEMICDFLSAKRTYDGEWPKVVDNEIQWEYLNKNIEKIYKKVHPTTRQIITEIFIEIFGDAYKANENSINNY